MTSLERQRARMRINESPTVHSLLSLERVCVLTEITGTSINFYHQSLRVDGRDNAYPNESIN